VRLAAENESMRNWTQEADALVYQMEQRFAHREGRVPDPRLASTGSFLERLRVFDGSVARVAGELDRAAETRQQLERTVAKHEHSIALLEQQLRQSVAGTVAMDDLLRQERDLSAATSADLKSAKSTVATLEQALRQKSGELDDAATQFAKLRTEAKAKLRELKQQLETKQQDYRNLSDAESRLNMELVQANDLLATERANAQQFRETTKHQLEANQQLVGVKTVIV